MKRICKCGCGEPFEPLTRNQQNAMGHRKERSRGEDAAVKAERRKKLEAARAYAETVKRNAERASAERSPMTCPHRAVRACQHPRWGGMRRDCMTQRAKVLCPLGFEVK